MKGGIITALGGMVTMLVGLIFAGILNTQAATSGSAANIGSFSGVRSFNDLLPLMFMVGRGLAPLYRKVEMLRRRIRGTLNWLFQHGNPEPSKGDIPWACVETRGLPTFQSKVEGIVQAQLKGWGTCCSSSASA